MTGFSYIFVDMFIYFLFSFHVLHRMRSISVLKRMYKIKPKLKIQGFVEYHQTHELGKQYPL